MQQYFYSPAPPPTSLFETIHSDQTRFDSHIPGNLGWQAFQQSNCYYSSLASSQYQPPHNNWPAVVHAHTQSDNKRTDQLNELYSRTPSWSIQAPDSDLELFAEHFKQRRMKLGVTQADVGKALGAMMIPGVGSLSQSTICRFESLTLSRTNMLALRPLLQIWIDRMEALGPSGSQSVESTREFPAAPPAAAVAADPFSPASGMQAGRRRKRTCITDSERRALEAYFVVQPQPSGERVHQIATLLGLPKSVVRVWFCNQRQKQKRLKVGMSAGAQFKQGVVCKR